MPNDLFVYFHLLLSKHHHMSHPSKHIQRSFDKFSNKLEHLSRQQRKLQKALEKYQHGMSDLLEILTDTELAYDAVIASVPIVKIRSNKNKRSVSNAPDTPSNAAGTGTASNELLAATKQMQETQMSFNLQYLQLQSAMQHENRSYTAISNIMKTKHDTVKHSISNIR